MRKCRRAFNLLEIMVVIGLLVVLVALGFVSTRRTAERSASRGLAQRVVAEFTAARQAAIAKQIPVAVVFPSNGASGLCQSLYWVEGVLNPRITRQVSFTTEFPGLYVFVGTWATTSGSFTADRPTTGREPYNFDLDKWLSSRPNLGDDFVYLFTPQGVAMSNNMPIVENAYRLAVGARPLVAGKPLSGGLPLAGSPPRFELSALADPQTVSLELTGECRQSDGIALGNVPEVGGEAALYNGGSLPPRTHVPKIPEITRIEVLPRADGEGTAATGTCGPDALVTLRVYATDDDGDALICNWRTSGGNFTSSGPTRMVYDQQEDAWISTWCFAGDGNAPTGVIYDLQCEVRDTNNNLATKSASVSDNRDLTFNRHPKIAFVDGGGDALYMAGPDGTDFQLIPLVGLKPGAPCQSPDGTSVVFGDRNLNNLWTVNLDGSAPRKLHSEGTCPAYSPDGTLIAYVVGGRLKVMLACGDQRPVPQWYLPVDCGVAGIDNRPPSWSPKGDAVCVTAGGAVTVVQLQFDTAGKPTAVGSVAVTAAYPGGSSGTAFGAFRPKPESVPANRALLLCCTPFSVSSGDLHVYYYDSPAAPGTVGTVSAGPANIDQMGGYIEPGINQGWMNPESSVAFSRDGAQVSYGYANIRTGDFDGSTISNGKDVCDVSAIFASWGTTTQP